MARIVDFAPDVELPGGYTFHRDDGSQLYAFGPDAEALASELERTRPADPRLAMGGAGGATGAGGGFEEANQLSQQAPAPPPPPVMGTPGVNMSTAPGQAPPDYSPAAVAAEQQAAPAALAPQPGAPAGPPSPYPEDTDPRFFDPRWTYVAPSAGRPGGFIPATQQVKTTDAAPAYGQVADALGDISIDRRMLQEELAQRESATARAQELQAAAALPELEMRVAERQSELAARQEQFNRVRADVDDMISAQRERRIDPNRWFASKSTAGQISTTIAQALGAFSALMLGGENFAQKKIDADIERDIASQEQEIRSGYADTDNALKRLQLQYGDVDTAKAALRMAMQDVAHMRAEEYAAATKSKTAVDAFRAWELDHLQKMAELEAELRTKAMGKIETTLGTKYQTPQRASRGGFRPATPGEIEKNFERQANIAKSKATIEGGGVSPDVMARERAQVSAEERKNLRGSAKELGEALALTEEKDRAFRDTISTAGLRFNEETGKVEMPAGHDIPGVGLADWLRSETSVVPGYGTGEEGQKVRSRLDNMLDLVLRKRTGAAATAGERESIRKMVIGRGTEEDFRSGLEMIQRMIQAERDAHRAAYGPEAVDKLEENRASLQSKRESENLKAAIKKY